MFRILSSFLCFFVIFCIYVEKEEISNNIFTLKKKTNKDKLSPFYITSLELIRAFSLERTWALVRKLVRPNKNLVMLILDLTPLWSIGIALYSAHLFLRQNSISIFPGELKENKKTMGRLALAAITSLWVIPMSIIVNHIVPDPYMDEIFHVPQAQQYCNGNFSSWDPMITTPPGL